MAREGASSIVGGGFVGAELYSWDCLGITITRRVVFFFAECHAITSLRWPQTYMALLHVATTHGHVSVAFRLFQLFMPSSADSVPLGCFLMLLASLMACHDMVRLMVFWSSVRDGVWVMAGLYGLAGSVLVYHTISCMLPISFDPSVTWCLGLNLGYCASYLLERHFPL